MKELSQLISKIARKLFLEVYAVGRKADVTNATNTNDNDDDENDDDGIMSRACNHNDAHFSLC